jgi:hypothetical protein
MGMLARAEAPAAKRKKLRREKPLQQLGSTIGDVMIGKAPSNEFGLNRRLLDTQMRDGGK